ADVLKGLEFRSIGPAITTGRVQDIAMDPKNPNTWYVAPAFGGLWKTTNRGTTFAPLVDGGGCFTLCCATLDPRDLHVVVARHGGKRQPAQRALRRRRLEVDRCRKDLEAHGTRRIRAHRPDPDRSAQLERRVRGGAGTAVVGGRRARPLQDDRRRNEVGPC